MLNERHDDSFKAIIEVCYRYNAIALLLILKQSPQQMPIGEQLLRIIEKLGILVAISFDSSKNERVNKIFEESHIGMTLCTIITSINICISLLIATELSYHLHRDIELRLHI